MTRNPNPTFNFADLFDVVAAAVPDRAERVGQNGGVKAFSRRRLAQLEVAVQLPFRVLHPREVLEVVAGELLLRFRVRSHVDEHQAHAACLDSRPGRAHAVEQVATEHAAEGGEEDEQERPEGAERLHAHPVLRDGRLQRLTLAERIGRREPALEHYFDFFVFSGVSLAAMSLGHRASVMSA